MTASGEAAKKDRAAVCTSRVTFDSTYWAFGLSAPVAIFMRKSWPLMVGFGAGAAYDMFKWNQCLNSPQEEIENEIKALQPQLYKEEGALVGKVQKDFDELERKHSPKSDAIAESK